MSILKDFEIKLENLAHDTKDFCRVLNESTELNKDFSLQIPKLLSSIDLPDQTFMGQEFSQFPLTILSKNGINLDLYHWIGANTSIHDHHFHGAFKVLRGKYVQRIYHFEATEKPIQGLSIGKLEIKEERTLVENEVVEIHPGDKFIHETWHPEGECVTACLRIKKTIGDLHSYISPGLKITHEILDLKVNKQLDCIHYLSLNFQQNEKEIKSLLSVLPDNVVIRIAFSVGVPNWCLQKMVMESAYKTLAERYGSEAWHQHIRTALLHRKLSY